MEKLFSAANSQKAETLGALLPEWLDEIYVQKWFKLFVPKELDGLGLNLREALLIEEELAKKDGSLGWTVTLCAGASWFVGFFEESLRNEVFQNPKVCLAGSGHVGGKAELIGDCYELSGNWTYASGASHATHFTANCKIFENGRQKILEDGTPLIKAFILKQEEVEILDSWKYMGMIATGSHAFRLKKACIPTNRCFEISSNAVKLSDPIYRFPFLQFAEATLAVNLLGISLHLHKLIHDSFYNRDKRKPFKIKEIQFFKESYDRICQEIGTLRQQLYQIVGTAETALDKEKTISSQQLQEISRVSRTLTQACREKNAQLYAFGGLEAANPNSELNRVWRDFHTVSQHSLLTFPF